MACQNRRITDGSARKSDSSTPKASSRQRSHMNSYELLWIPQRSYGFPLAFQRSANSNTCTVPVSVRAWAEACNDSLLPPPKYTEAEARGSPTNCTTACGSAIPYPFWHSSERHSVKGIIPVTLNLGIPEKSIILTLFALRCQVIPEAWLTRQM